MFPGHGCPGGKSLALMHRNFIGVALVTLLVALSGGATYWLLKPALTPAAAPVEVAAHAAAPSQSAAPTATPFTRVQNPRRNAADFQAGVMVLVYGNDPYFTLNIRNKLDYL